ncbi:MAG TPA: hypothetical protein O0X50_01240 [Methanocorpusculum sp.]|nr:hypothetical protein [Methanocorpusculum sp.]
MLSVGKRRLAVTGSLVMNSRHTNLIIDREFQRLVYPCSLEELDRMEEEIDRTGIRVWNKFVLVDFEKYEYCCLHEKLFFKRSIALKNRTEAVIWICRNQLKRRFLPNGMRRYLYGVLSLAEQTLSDSSGEKTYRIRLRQNLAEDYSLTPQTIQRYEVLVRCLDYLDDIYPAFTKAVLSDQIIISQKRIEDLSHLPARDIPQECKRLLNAPPAAPPANIIPKPAVSPPAPPTIKDMPDYDPDSEIASLTLTIPVWIGSIRRVGSADSIPFSTGPARENLTQALNNLISAAGNLIDRLKEK